MRASAAEGGYDVEEAFSTVVGGAEAARGISAVINVASFMIVA